MQVGQSMPGLCALNSQFGVAFWVLGNQNHKSAPSERHTHVSGPQAAPVLPHFGQLGVRRPKQRMTHLSGYLAQMAVLWALQHSANPCFG